MTAESVLADIDGALAAYGTVTGDWASPDAMRWKPEQPELVICHGTGLLMPERWNVWHHGTYQISVTADLSGFVAGMEAAGRAIQEWACSAHEAMASTGKMIAAAYGLHLGGRGELHYHAEDAPRRVLLRCRVCHPSGYQSPAPIDGREYHRRQRARVRRRGR
jgi:hypothetical protein